MQGKIETLGFLFFYYAQTHDGIQHLQDNQGHNTSVNDGSNDAVELHANLLAHGLDLTAESGTAEGGGCEYTREKSADDSADGMHTEHIQRIVITKRPLDFGGGKEATHTRGQANDQCTHGAHCTGSRGDRHQAGNRTGPSTLGLPCVIHSLNIQVTAAVAAAI